jgi:hypothetical protein
LIGKHIEATNWNFSVDERLLDERRLDDVVGSRDVESVVDRDSVLICGILCNNNSLFESPFVEEKTVAPVGR